ncbi:hypothetical protein M8J76_015879 [Diaphorina citri]|nr:hypothetical protein M8J76_015879 [Diaphorina citri]
MLIEKDLTLRESSKSYRAWKHTTLPLYLDFYMFNWTNPQESLSNPNVKPIVVEVGPYVFREVHEKLNLTWNANNTVSYWQRRTWYFEPELSRGSLSDEITNVNVVAVTIATMADQIHVKYSDLVKKIINMFLKNTEKKLYIKKTVRELLFDGYDDGVLDLMKKLENLIKIPVQDRFGWFYPRNTSDTYDGLVNIHTGVDDLTELGMMGAWNYMNQTPYYTGNCGKVQGSAGDLYPPAIASEDAFSIYATDICSGINVKSTNSESMVHDLSGTLFVADKSVFDNGTQCPDSSCYCPNNICSQPSGIRDLSPCKHGAPAYLSFPHFYQGDPSYSNAVRGLSPNKSQHEFSIVLEKNTGIPLQVNARLQINILLRKIKDLDITDGLTHLVMPALWFHQHTIIPEDMANELRPLTAIPTFAFTVAVSLFVFGVLGLLTGLLCVKKGYLGNGLQETQEPPLLDDTRAEPNSQPQASP